MTHSPPIPIDSSVTDSMLQHEADRIHSAIFGGIAPPILRERFVAPSQRLNAATVTRDVERYYQALEHARDLEALELACRRTGQLPIITLKFRLMVYLAETLPENQRHFVNPSDSFARGAFTVARALVRAPFKYLRGRALLRRFSDE